MRARWLVERLALALQAALLLRTGHTDIAETFCASRLAGAHGYAFGTLPAGAAVTSLIERAAPAANSPNIRAV